MLNRHYSPSLVVLLLGLAAGCDSSATDDGAERSDTPGAAAPTLPKEIHWFRNSAEYRASTLQAYKLAALRLEAAYEAGQLVQPWAVSVDVDETILDNSQYQKERAALGLGFSQESFTEWVHRKEAPAIAGAPEFAAKVHELGGRLAAVTNRLAEECPDTAANLASEKLEVDLLLCKTDTSEKEPRWQAIEDGTADSEQPKLDIVLWVGDNIADFPDLTQDIRLEDDDTFADFAGRFIVLPNPMYGSWEKNAQD